MKQCQNCLARTDGVVAPHAGAWIETENDDFLKNEKNAAHPTRVRGLKLHQIDQSDKRCQGSHPTRVRGLKRSLSTPYGHLCWSYPKQVRPEHCLRVRRKSLSVTKKNGKRRKKRKKRLEKRDIGHICAVSMSGCLKAPRVGAGRRPVRMSPVPV